MSAFVPDATFGLYRLTCRNVFLLFLNKKTLFV